MSGYVALLFRPNAPPLSAILGVSTANFDSDYESVPRRDQFAIPHERTPSQSDVRGILPAK